MQKLFFYKPLEWQHRHRLSTIPILLTYFIDQFGLAIVFFLFSPLVVNETFSIPLSLPERPVLAFFIILIFPLAQALGAPLFGSYSDIFGRKKIFLISIAGTILGNAIMGAAFYWNIFSWFLIGRLLAGFCAGNLTLCLASLADISSNRNKVHNFSLLAAAGGLSYICAIVSGNVFANISPSFPFWMASILGVINITFLFIFFKDLHRSKTSEPFGFLNIIQSIERLFKSRHLNLLYLCFFFFMLTWTPSLQFLPKYLGQEFQFSEHQILILMITLGLLWSLTNALLSHFSPLFSFRTLLRLLILLTCFLALAGFLSTPSFFIAAFIITNIAAALTWTYLFVGISNQASLTIQGEVLGVSQAIGSIAVLIGLELQQHLSALFPHEYYLFAAGVIFLATLSASLSRAKNI